MNVIKKNSPFTLTYQLTSILHDDILNRKYSEGSLFYTEDELIKIYGVSRITVRKALGNLVQEGLLYRERGRGSFVSKKKILSDATRLTSTTSTFRELGIKSEIKLLKIEKVKASQIMSDKLGLEEETKVYKLQRLRLADGEPIIFEINYLPEKLFPKIDTMDLNHSLYELMESKYNIKLIGASETFTAIIINKKLATILNYKLGSPAFIMTGVTYRLGRIPTTFEESIYRGDRFEIKVEANATQPGRGLNWSRNK